MTKKGLIEYLSAKLDNPQTISLDVHMPLSEQNAGGIGEILRPEKIKVLIIEDV